MRSPGRRGMNERMTANAVEPFRVVFVCTGNICRSPMAEVVFRALADSAGVGDRVLSTSAGTGSASSTSAGTKGYGPASFTASCTTKLHHIFFNSS